METAVISQEIIRPALDSAKSDNIFVDQIAPSLLNPRKHFDGDDLKELAESITKHGLIEPIVVRCIRDQEPGRLPYEIVVGERRWRAAKLAGLQSIPCRIALEMDDKTSLEIALIENLQRKDINPIEEAEGYAKLQELGYKQREIEEKVNRTQGAVSNSIRLLKLPEEICDDVRAGKMSQSHARALLPYIEYPKLLAHLRDRALAGIKTNELEKWPRWLAYQMQNGPGIVKVLELHKSEMKWQQNCKENKCGHCRKVDDEWVCLNPECWADKKRDWDLEQEKKLKERNQMKPDAQVKQITDVGKNKIDLSGWSNEVSGCPEKCSKRELCKRTGDGKLIELCTDPDCHARMKRRETKERNKDRRSELADLQQLFVDRLSDKCGESAQDLLAATAAVACYGAICTGHYVDHTPAVEKAIRRYNLGIEPDAILQPRMHKNETLDILRSIGHIPCLMIAAEIVMRKEIVDADPRCGRGDTDSVKWFTAGMIDAGDDAPADLDDIDRGSIVSPCEECPKQAVGCDRDCPDPEPKDEPTEEPEDKLEEVQEAAQPDIYDQLDKGTLIRTKDGVTTHWTRMGLGLVTEKVSGRNVMALFDAGHDGRLPERLSPIALTDYEIVDKGPFTADDLHDLSWILHTSVEAAQSRIKSCSKPELLRVAIEQENHRDEPRKSLLQALESRLRKLGSDNTEAASDNTPLRLRIYWDPKDGREVFVSSGLGDDTFGAFKRRQSGGLERVKSEAVPMVQDRKEAQRNLDKYAPQRGWTIVREEEWPEDSAPEGDALADRGFFVYNESRQEYVQVDGESLKIECCDLDLFVHEHLSAEGMFAVSEGMSGGAVSKYLIGKDQAIAQAKERIAKVDMDALKKQICEVVGKHGISPRWKGIYQTSGNGEFTEVYRGK